MIPSTRRPPRRPAIQWVARGVGAACLSVLMVPVQLFAIIAAPLSMTPARAAVEWFARVLTWVDGADRGAHPSRGRLILLLAIQTVLGLLNGVVLVLIAVGFVVAWQMVAAASTGQGVPIFAADPGEVTWRSVAGYALPGLVLIFLAVSGLAGIAWLGRWAWTALSRPGVGELTREVSRLHGTLDDVVAAVDSERRRIERDIHDGVQQRVVGLSILLARAERTDDHDQQRDLQQRARAETQHILDDLRSVAWRTYPHILVRDGLPAALEALRDRTEVPIDLRTDMTRRIDRAAESAAYFVASEAVTNVLKHANADTVSIEVTERERMLTLVVRDDGRGGANPQGPGLSGIASRVAACGGQLRIDSPPGGPTILEAVIPCA